MTRQFISGVLIVVSSVFLGAQTGTKYDRATEKTFAGSIKTVVSFPAADGSVGVHFDLKQDDGKIVSVHLAPAMYVGMQNFWFFADDKVTIIGSKVTVDGNVSIWAKSVQKGESLLVARNADGTPKWTGDDGIDGCGVNHLPLQRGTERN
ncbi:MAG TPA: hypothetical protein VFA59_18890 [Vicinamibacterales bacterium]|nr:hypothetical protein [Vicinamibacterales bacterium]